MITEKLKAKVIAELKRGRSTESLAEKYDVAEPLIKEWYNKLDIRDLTIIEANVNAVGELLSGELVEPCNREILKNKLEEAAIDIARLAPGTVSTGDMVFANTLKLAAEAISKLYQTIILQQGAATDPSGHAVSSKSISAFQSQLRD